jgi:signal transduction histidine kinase
LRVKVSLMILIPSVLIITASSVLQYRRQRQDALKSMSVLASHTGDVIENALRHDMLISDFDHIQTVFDSIGEDSRIGTLLLMDTSGKVIFAPDRNGVGNVLSNTTEACQPCHALAANERPAGVITTANDGQQYFRSMHPIENREACMRCHDPGQRLIGVLLTDLSITPIEQSLTKDLRNNLLWSLGTTLVIIILVGVAIQHWVVQPIDDIGKAIEGFDRHRPPPVLPEGAADEIGRLSSTFNEMTRRIRLQDQQNEALSDKLHQRVVERGNLLRRLITAQEEERKRLARELHDELGQGLSSMAIQVALAERHLGIDPQAAKEHLEQIEQLLDESTSQMDDLISGLRPAMLDDLGLQASLRALAKRTLIPAGLAIDLDMSCLSQELPGELETVLYRVVQEALTNVVRHAGASHVDLKLACEDGWLICQLADDGTGFDQDQVAASGRENGMGLLGMRERIEQVGGEIQIESGPGAGTSLRARLPLEGENNG